MTLFSLVRAATWHAGAWIFPVPAIDCLSSASRACGLIDFLLVDGDKDWMCCVCHHVGAAGRCIDAAAPRLEFDLI